MRGCYHPCSTDAVLEGVSEGAPDSIAPVRVAGTSTTIYDVDSEGAEATSSASASDNPFDKDAEFQAHTASEINF